MLATLDAPRYVDNKLNSVPVVELRPFVSKQWLPSKSRPSYDHSGRAQTSLGISSTTHTKITPRSSSNTGPCPRAFSVASDKISRHPRIKETAVEVSKSDSPIPAFVNKMERQKSTFEDIKSGRNVSSQFSCMKRSLTELDIAQQQDIKVKGKRMQKLPPRLTRIYGEPWQLYASSAKKGNQIIVDTMTIRIESLQNAYFDENIYDAFDRANTLPSIHVKQAHIPQTSTTTSHSGYKLGVTNAFHAMSHYGKPLGVEQQISSDLKQTLQHLRRTKENVQLQGTRAWPSKLESGQLTPGEASIYQHYTQNSHRSGAPKVKSVVSDPGGDWRFMKSSGFSKDSASSHGAKSAYMAGTDLTSTSQRFSTSSITSWKQAESIAKLPQPPTLIKPLSQTEFTHQHQISAPATVLETPRESEATSSKPEIIDTTTNNDATNSQTVLTIPTDDGNNDKNKSDTFITDNKQKENSGDQSGSEDVDECSQVIQNS